MGQGGLNWWERRTTVVVLALVAMVPLLWPTIPPLMDLPAHMASYRVQLDGEASGLRRFYDFHWSLIGNLGVDLLIIPFARVFGLEFGTKLIVLAIPALTVVGLLWVAREVHGCIPPTAFFALPLAYSYSFQFGFVNYSLALALALLAFALWLRLARLGHLQFRTALFVVIAPILWVTHLFGWGVFGILAFSAELIRQRDRGVTWSRACAYAILTCLPLALPVAWMVFGHDAGSVGETGQWFDWGSKFASITLMLRDRWAFLDVPSVVLLVMIIVYGLVSSGLQFSRTLVTATFLLGIVYLGLPQTVSGLIIYGDQRLSSFMFAVAILAISPAPDQSRIFLKNLALAGLIFFGARMAINTASLTFAATRQNRALAALDHLPAGARVVTFTQPEWGDRMGHLSAMAVVRRSAFSNAQWDLGNQGLLSVNKPDALSFSADPSQFVSGNDSPGKTELTLDAALGVFPRNAFDYLWLIDPPAYNVKLTEGMTPIWRDGSDVLFRIDHK
jgi:hypothetical protein